MAKSWDKVTSKRTSKPATKESKKTLQSELRYLKEVFDAFDHDFDGVVEIVHLITMLRAAGFLLTKQSYKEIIYQHGMEEQKFIDLSQFFIMVFRIRKELEELFNDDHEKILNEQVRHGFKGMYVEVTARKPQILYKKIINKSSDIINSDEIDRVRHFTIPKETFKKRITGKYGEPLTIEEYEAFINIIPQTEDFLVNEDGLADASWDSIALANFCIEMKDLTRVNDDDDDEDDDHEDGESQEDDEGNVVDALKNRPRSMMGRLSNLLKRVVSKAKNNLGAGIEDNLADLKYMKEAVTNAFQFDDNDDYSSVEFGDQSDSENYDNDDKDSSSEGHGTHRSGRVNTESSIASSESSFRATEIGDRQTSWSNKPRSKSMKTKSKSDSQSGKTKFRNAFNVAFSQ